MFQLRWPLLLWVCQLQCLSREHPGPPCVLHCPLWENWERESPKTGKARLLSALVRIVINIAVQFSSVCACSSVLYVAWPWYFSGQELEGLQLEQLKAFLINCNKWNYNGWNFSYRLWSLPTNLLVYFRQALFNWEGELLCTIPEVINSEIQV